MGKLYVFRYAEFENAIYFDLSPVGNVQKKKAIKLYRFN